MTRWKLCVTRIAQPALYTREQWLALILSVVCLAIDGRAIYQTWAEAETPEGLLSHSSASSPVMWMTEVALIIAGLGLLWFAFSRHPDQSDPL